MHRLRKFINTLELVCGIAPDLFEHGTATRGVPRACANIATRLEAVEHCFRRAGAGRGVLEISNARGALHDARTTATMAALGVGHAFDMSLRIL